MTTVTDSTIGTVCTAAGDECTAMNNEVCDTGSTDKCICATGYTADAADICIDGKFCSLLHERSKVDFDGAIIGSEIANFAK